MSWISRRLWQNKTNFMVNFVEVISHLFTRTGELFQMHPTVRKKETGGVNYGNTDVPTTLKYEY